MCAQVHELCSNFCDRYINCLKGKLPADLVSEDAASDTSSTTGHSPSHTARPPKAERKHDAASRKVRSRSSFALIYIYIYM